MEKRNKEIEEMAKSINSCDLLLINENKSNNFEIKSNNELFKQALVEGLNRHFDKTIEEAKKIEQIEEMVDDIDAYIESVDVKHWYSDELDEGLAGHLYNAGYRKQSEGEWKRIGGDLGYVEMECSVCRYTDVFDNDNEPHKFCPECGAKMKGGEKQ